MTLAGNAVSNTTKALITNEDIVDEQGNVTGSIKSDVSAGGGHILKDGVGIAAHVNVDQDTI